MPPHIITWRGVTKPRVEWSKIVGIKNSTIKSRIKAGWTIERALTEKPFKS